jgi:hypothetical protein
MTEAERDAAMQELSDAYQANKVALYDFKDAQKKLDLAVKATQAAQDRLSKAKQALDELILKASDDPTDTLLKH